MDNETKEMLQLILKNQEKMSQELSEIKQLATNTAKELSVVKQEVASIKKDTAITRVAVNELISWTDTAANIIDVPFLKAK